ncbi:DUF551 domain-containing protein [Cronobacter sakazakii]|uniref:DUF551 domain-containing protein n=1 Tax=Cronobacter sakazakii TaxID=28141 RepID=UPI001FB7B2C0|nr:DUF551 domain-containing protein [Cronobacter sakazakii]
MSTISNDSLEKLSLQRDELLAALEDIIAYNVQYATDKYGDALKAETMACVRRCREAIARVAMLNQSQPVAETDTTSQQFESLAGKAVGRSDGFECTPVADLYELLTKCGECYDYTTSAKVAADWIKEGYSAREYVKLDRLQEDMTHGSSREPDGWIPCSERMPEVGDIVLTADNGCVNVGEMERSGASCRYFTSVVSGRELPATHWQPLPEPPCK